MSETTNAMGVFIKSVKDEMNLLVVMFAGIPVISDYLAPGRIPNFGVPNGSKWFSICAGIIVIATTKVLFSIRKTLSDKIFLLIGLLSVIASVILGVLIIPTYIKLEDSNDHSLFPMVFSLLLLTVVAAGIQIVFLYSFVNEAERTRNIGDKFAELLEDEWKNVETLTNAIVSVRKSLRSMKETDDKCKLAFYVSFNSIFTKRIASVINVAEQRTIRVDEGATIHEIYSKFLEITQAKFRALSFDDLSFWASDHSRPYLNSNLDAIRRNLFSVERIFIIPRNHKFTGAEIDAITCQINGQIIVRIAFKEVVEALPLYSKNEFDFGLFDEFAISYFKFEQFKRSFEVSIEPAQVKQNLARYESVLQNCESHVVGKNIDVFNEPQQFQNWVAKHPTLKAI